MTSETPKIDDFDSYCLQIFALRAKVDTFGVDGSEFLIGFGPLQNPTPQIGYPYAVAHGVPQIGPYLPPELNEKISHGKFFDGKLRNFSSSKAPFLRNFSIFPWKICDRSHIMHPLYFETQFTYHTKP